MALLVACLYLLTEMEAFSLYNTLHRVVDVTHTYYLILQLPIVRRVLMTSITCVLPVSVQ